MGRLGFLSRIMLFLMAALLAVIVATLGIDRLARPSVHPLRGQPQPRIVHAAGVIGLLRGADAARRQVILRAASSAFLQVSIADAPPKPEPGDVRATRIEARLRQMVGVPLAGLQAYAVPGTVSAPSRSGVGGQLKKAVAPLEDGRSIVIEWFDPPPIDALKLFGLPPSAWAGILGFGVAALAVVAAMRELRPLRQLTESVSAFDGAPPAGPVEASGASDVQHLVNAVHGMQERVAALLAERSFLIGAISHDLRTYLTRLRLRTESIADGEARERMVGDLDAMTRLIDTSLAFARGTTSSQSRIALDLSDLVAAEVEEHNARGLPLALDATYASDAIVVGDPVALRRVVCNILDNAVKFASSCVTVCVERTATHERIVIEDDGPGIPEAERGNVFDPFYRVERSRSRTTGGTGLGLAIARQIVEAHGGTIEVAAARLPGAAFEIQLPAGRH